MKTAVSLAITALCLLAPLAMPLAARADDSPPDNRLDRRLERVEDAFDRKDTRSGRRHDRAIEGAETRGRDGLAQRLETREDRLDSSRDQREERLTNRLERRYERLEDWRNR
jgi:hypothetical protein